MFADTGIKQQRYNNLAGVFINSIHTDYFIISLTGAVCVDHKTLVDMVLDEQKSLLEDLPSTCLLHCVGVTWIPEKS